MVESKTSLLKSGSAAILGRAKRTDLPRPLDLASEGIVIADAKGLIIDINSAALALLQCATDAWQGIDFWDVVPEAIAEAHQAETVDALATAEHHAFIAHHEFADSWLQYAFTRHPQNYVVNLKNVTPLQQLQRRSIRSERHSQVIFYSNPNAMWIFDAVTLRIRAVNNAAAEFYGIPRKMFINLNMKALFPDGEGASLLSLLQSSSKLQLAPKLCKQRKADGGLVLVELACARIEWEDRPSILVSVVDLTDRHLADRGLRRDNAELEQSVAELTARLENNQRDLTAFTHALSNDLQGPLHAANGFASMLMERHATALEGPGRHYVNRIQASIGQLAKLVDGLHTLVRLPAISPDVDTLELATLCAPLVDELRRRDPDRKVTFEVRGSAVLQGDGNLLAIALGCLIDNAWKFTARKPESWIRIDLTAGEEDEEVVLQVSDNGSGFDTSYADRLFTAFERLHSSADFPGSGLGLAIVKKVAERHGGVVWATSNDSGANFFMSFPHGAAPPPAPAISPDAG